jgi:hypothetical protein
MITAIVTPIVAQAGGATYSASWALVIFCVFLGLSLTLNPSRRTSEIKRARH